MENANSTEFDPDTPYPVVGLITEWLDADGSKEIRDVSTDLGGTMRLGSQKCHLLADSKVATSYGATEIFERHRHRYEVNNNLRDEIEKAGLTVSGLSSDKALVEVIELENHPFFVAGQFHPEFNSTPRDGHPLFTGFIAAAGEYHKSGR
jgi:CTP synthase